MGEFDSRRLHFADVAQWQSARVPTWKRGLDSRRPHRRRAAPAVRRGLQTRDGSVRLRRASRISNDSLAGGSGAPSSKRKRACSTHAEGTNAPVCYSALRCSTPPPADLASTLRMSMAVVRLNQEAQFFSPSTERARRSERREPGATPGGETARMEQRTLDGLIRRCLWPSRFNSGPRIRDGSS
jgi:hypothetical protein